jgi:hypothetical protein
MHVTAFSSLEFFYVVWVLNYVLANVKNKITIPKHNTIQENLFPLEAVF